MKVQVIFYLSHIFVIHAITVPPIWPSKINKQTTTTSSITHGDFKFPNFFPEDLSKSSSRDELRLHFEPSNHQNVHIYHPPPIRSNTKNHSPQSFQTVNFDKNPNVYIYPKVESINKQSTIRQNRRPIKKKLPVVHQHLTEVTAIPPPRNLNRQRSTQSSKRYKPTIIENKVSRADTDPESSENLEEISEHETPRDVPTRPDYPGEGQWSKFGLKHKPYPENRDSVIKVQETAEDETPEDDKPEGYETFERGDEQFAIARNKFKNNIVLFPQKHELPVSQIDDDDEEASEPLYKKPEIGFVPQKLYAQVRRTENEQHLPRSAIDSKEDDAERLRETVKDSIIHTVYTEEGYEDSAYDHAGHEKNAEDSEGHAEKSSDQTGSKERGHGRGNSRYSDEGGKRYGANNERRKLRNKEKTNTENFEDDVNYQNAKKKIEHDAEHAASNHEAKKILNKAELPLKEFKKVTVKSKDHEDINMEIHTETKYTPQLKKHKYIKIIPSAKQPNETEKTQETHVRVKRYDKEQLSKRYIRKRPSYYWKKNKTSTVNRTTLEGKKFENAFKTGLKIKPVRTTTEVPQNTPENPENVSTPKSLQNSATKLTSTTTTSTTPYTITLPPVSRSSITVTPIHHSTSPSGISAPKLVEELHPDLMNPELTTKSPKHSAPKTLPVKIKKFVGKKRTKRYTIDYPKIKVDLTGFVDVDKLPNPTEKPDLTFVKYPYYNLPISEHLNENSPLRYAEDAKTVPQKIENEMSFYESRNHIICQEVESNVNPIPDGVAKQEEGEETDKMAETPNLPRLSGLGDKIDCYKEKYFGENPLDSPFFQEDIIESPTPLFMVNTGQIKKPLSYKNTKDKKMAATSAMYYKMRKFDKDAPKKHYKYNNQQQQQQDGYSKKRELKVQILEPIVVLDEEIMESVVTMNPAQKTTEAVLKPPFTLEQMMSMKNEKYVRFNPLNDFDQISLLDKKQNKADMNPDKFLIIYENHQDVFTKNNPEQYPKQRQTKMRNKLRDESRISEIVTDYTSSSFNKNEKTATSTLKPETYTRRQYTKRPTKKPITKLSAKSIKKPQPRTTTIKTPVPTTTVQNNYKLPYISKVIPKPGRVIQTSSSSVEPEEYKYPEIKQSGTRKPSIQDSYETSYVSEIIPQAAREVQTTTSRTSAELEEYDYPEIKQSRTKKPASIQDSYETPYISKQTIPQPARVVQKTPSPTSAELEEYDYPEIKQSRTRVPISIQDSYKQTIPQPVRVIQKTPSPTSVELEEYDYPEIKQSRTRARPSIQDSYETPYIPEIIPQHASDAQTSSNSTKSEENVEPEIKQLPSEITSTIPPALPENWPSLNRRLSSFYNIFDITQYFTKLPNHRIVPTEPQYKEEITPNDQMKVYDDVLKTINENKDEESQEEISENQQPQNDQSEETSSEEAILVQGSLPVRTTTEQYADYSQKISGLVPPPNSLPYQQVYQYYNEYLLSPPPSEVQVAEASQNYKTYYFVGLMPPKNQKQKRLKRDLSGQNVDDLLAEESNIDENYIGSNHKRIKRFRKPKPETYPEDDLMAAESENRPQYTSPQRRQKIYTEIVRNKPRAQTEEPEEEEEDLNPRKRYYELRSSTRTTTESYPEFEEIVEEPEEITEAPTTRKPKIFSVEANKQNPQIAEYIFFIEKLKEKWAKEDATSTTTSTTTQATTKSVANSPKVAESRGEPAFLQIISQLHNIRKEEEAKTSTEPTIEITSAKIQAIPVKNSNPFFSEATDSFMTELKAMQLNLDHDNTAEGSTNPEVSRTRNYIDRFKTSIDTSKYKTIERNPVNLRHNFSSRYNADDEELPLKRGQTTQTPTIIAIISKPEDDETTETPEEREIIAKVITERILEDSKASSTLGFESPTTPTIPTTSTTSTTSTTTTLRSRQRTRGRSRPSTSTTVKPITSSTTNPLFRRRRPTRPTTTTTQSPTTITNQFRRRNRLKTAETRSILPIPLNHKPIEESTSETTVVITPPSEEPKKQRRFQKVQERRVTSEVTLTRYFEPLSGELEESEEQGESKKHQYEVIGPLAHTDTGHGGNYKHEHEPTPSEEDVSTISDVTIPSESFYSDPSLAENVNLLKDAKREENGKPQATNNLFTNEEIAEKVAAKPLHSKVNLYPNMARMVNRLADSQTQDQDSSDETNEKPTFIKDPSRRMYYYAKL